MYKTIKCKTADEFWQYLDPVNPLKMNFSKEQKRRLLYRGQEDANFKLLPACFRLYIDKTTYESKLTAEKQVNNEYKELKNFVQSQAFYEYKGKVNFEYNDNLLSVNSMFSYFKNPSVWPAEELYPVLFLAQHHGASTRLLDWSKKSYYAVYFACQPILMNDKELNGELAVWCYLSDDSNPDIFIEESPKYFDKNMEAQDGRFSLVKQNMPNAKSKFKIKTLDDVAAENLLWKITVPKTEVFDLLSKCDDNDINAEKLYKGRGLDSVTLGYKERELLQNKLEPVSEIENVDGLSEV